MFLIDFLRPEYKPGFTRNGKNIALQQAILGSDGDSPGT
jgi:hypothetical protein